MIWKSINIKGFTHYAINEKGGIINTRTCKRVLGWSNKQGYNRVKLSGYPFKCSKQFYIHRLVLLTFEPLPDNLLEVHHINGKRYDNSIANLKWVTHQKNMSYVHGTNTSENDDFPF
jgi:hypothetical protein